MGIKQQIDALRSQGYTQQEIADMLGVSRQAVCHHSPKRLEDCGYYSFYPTSRLFHVEKHKLHRVCRELNITPRRTSGEGLC